MIGFRQTKASDQLFSPLVDPIADFSSSYGYCIILAEVANIDWRISQDSLYSFMIDGRDDDPHPFCVIPVGERSLY